MNLLEFYYQYADEPTMRMAAVLPEPTYDEVERYILQQIHMLFSLRCPEGYVPGTSKLWVEQYAENARDLLDDLHACRRIKFDSPNKIQPEKRRRWIWG